MDISNGATALRVQMLSKASAVTGSSHSPFLIGVTGGTGAGKTTFARRLAKVLATRQTVTFVDLESYYKDFSFLSLPERQQVNFDDPESVDLVRFREDLHRLRQGQAIVKPVYDLVTCTRHAGGPVIVPGDVVVIEGLMLFIDESVHCLFDLKIYINTPAEIRLRRRLERDVREGGHTLAGAIDHYMSSVLPIHDRFIEPTKGVSSFVVPGWEDTVSHLDEVVSAIRRSLNQAGCRSCVSINPRNTRESFSVEESVPNQGSTES
jgi:uridine kinase